MRNVDIFVIDIFVYRVTIGDVILSTYTNGVMVFSDTKINENNGID